MSTIAASETPFYGEMNSGDNAGIQNGFVSAVMGTTIPADNSQGWNGWDPLQMYSQQSLQNRFIMGFDNNTNLPDTDQGLHHFEITGRFDGAAASAVRTMILRRGVGSAYQSTTDGALWTFTGAAFGQFDQPRPYLIKWYRSP